MNHQAIVTRLLGLDALIARLSARPITVQSTFVYRPGYTGNAVNVFASWPVLYAAFSQVQGGRTIEIDDGIVSPAVIPAGTYNLSDTILSGPLEPPLNGVPLGGATQVMYAMVLKAVASGFFRIGFSGTMTPGGADTVTLTVRSLIPTVFGTAPVLANNTAVGTSVGANSSCNVSNNAAGITVTIAGGSTAATMAVQTQISAASDLDMPYGFTGDMGPTQVVVGNFVVFELLVSAAGATVLTPLAGGNAMWAYELP